MFRLKKKNKQEKEITVRNQIALLYLQTVQKFHSV